MDLDGQKKKKAKKPQPFLSIGFNSYSSSSPQDNNCQCLSCIKLEYVINKFSFLGSVLFFTTTFVLLGALWWHKPVLHLASALWSAPYNEHSSHHWSCVQLEIELDIVSRKPFTCIGSLVHRHRQLDNVIHPLCVLGFLWLLTHNPLLHQEPEGFGWVGPRATVPLWVKINNYMRENLGTKKRSWVSVILPPPCLWSAIKTPEHPVVDWWRTLGGPAQQVLWTFVVLCRFGLPANKAWTVWFLNCEG